MLIPKEVLGAIINGSQEFVDDMRKHGVTMVLTGGETADVGDLVRTVIVDSTVTAKIPMADIVDNARMCAGDVIVGFSSSGQATYETSYNSGIGSNGLTSARHDVFMKALAKEFPESFDPNMPEDLVYAGNTGLEDLIDADKEAGRIPAGKLILSPTRTYAPIVHKIFASGLREKINGMIHCSGGGQTKVLHFAENVHVIKNNLFPTPPVFELIQKNSEAPWDEMYKVFNMGHRLEIYTDRDSASAMINIAKTFNVDAQIIGHVEPLQASEKKATLTIQSQHGEFRY
jgi:phosphoribosylformylglycinamidine cyclo-ligase